jgi:hypothetical protein
VIGAPIDQGVEQADDSPHGILRANYRPVSDYAGSVFPIREGSAVIIRVLHEGQYEIAEESLRGINDLDQRMFDAVVAGDSGAFQDLLHQVLAVVRAEGHMLAVDDLRPSDHVLPAPDSTLEEVRSLFGQEGHIKTS